MNQALADPYYPDDTGTYYQWSTNAYVPPSIVPPYGVVNQIIVSQDPKKAPTDDGTWSQKAMPFSVDTTPAAEAAYFFWVFCSQLPI